MTPKYFTSEQITTLENAGLSKNEIKRLYSYAKGLVINIPLSMDEATEAMRNMLSKLKVVK